MVYYDELYGGVLQGDGNSGGGGGIEDLVGGTRIAIGASTISFVNSADIVNVTGTSVTIEPDTAYKIYATAAAVTINANPPAAGKWAYEGHLEIFTAGTGYIVTGTNVVLANALEPDAVNNCVVRFHDGVAIIDVEDHVAGYIVVNGSTSGDGSLYYGIATSTNDYVAFDASLNGTTIPLAGAVAEGEKHLVGNGYTSTTLTGAVDCGTSKFTVANLSLQNVQVTGGTMTLGDAFIPSGSTVAVSGGGLAVEKVTGNGGVIDLGGGRLNADSTQVNIGGIMVTNGERGFISQSTNGTVFVSGCTFSNNKTGISVAGRDTAYIFVDCIISNNTYAVNPNGSGMTYCLLSSCTIESSTTFGLLVNTNPEGAFRLYDCTIKDSFLVNMAGRASNSIIVFGGSNSLTGYVSANNNNSTGRLNVTLTSGAILDLTGNTNATPIAPGGGIVFEAGGATILYGSSGGVVSSAVLEFSENQKVYSIGNFAEIAVTDTYYINHPKEMRLANCTLYNATATGQLYIVFSTAEDAAKVFAIENCDIGKDNETYGISLGGNTGTLNCNNVSFRGNSKVYQNNSQTVTLNLSGTIFIHGLSGNIALQASVVNISANAYLDVSDCESIYVMQGTITFGAGVKIKKRGTGTYVDLVEGGTAGTCYRIERNGTIVYSA